MAGHELLPVDAVLAQVLARVALLDTQYVPTPQALGRILASEITARENIPPAPTSSMDGYAVRVADVLHATPKAPVVLDVIADVPAGVAPQCVVGQGQAARIMTGAPTPEGADAVVPVEHTNDAWHAAEETPLPAQVAVFQPVKSGENVRPVGESVRVGQTVLHTGQRLRPQELGLLIALGEANVPVFRQPRVAIIATGDELIDVHEPLTPGKVRNTNSYVLEGLARQCGAVPLRLAVARDTFADVRARFDEALAQQPDVVLSIGGVSMGTRDVVRAVVDELGAVELWRVNMRPGRPLAFGHVGNALFFGLPGNPVSAMVTFEVFVRPVLAKMQGRRLTPPTVIARLGEDMRSDGRRTYARVRLEREGDEWVAYSTGTQSSGVLLSMVQADGLLIIPEGTKEVSAGARLPVRLLREPN